MIDMSISAIEPSSSPPLLPAILPPMARKRTRPSFHIDDNTPSDPPMFSSDPPDPSLEHYFQPRRKKQYRGTWWSSHSTTANDDEVSARHHVPKAEFTRNMDSGVWMGSDTTEDSLPSEIGIASQVEEQVPVPTSSVSVVARRPPETEALRRAREIIQDCIDNDFDQVDLSNLELPSIPGEFLQRLNSIIKRPLYLEDGYSPEEDDYDQLQSSIYLILERNALWSLPPELFDLRNITRLNLRNNNLTTLSPHIAKLEQLVHLDVASNRLRWLPWELLGLIRKASTTVVVLPNPLLQPFSFQRFLRTERIFPLHWTQPTSTTEIRERLKSTEDKLGQLLKSKDHDGQQSANDASDNYFLANLIEQGTWMQHLYKAYATRRERAWEASGIFELRAEDIPPEIREGHEGETLSDTIARLTDDPPPLQWASAPIFMGATSIARFNIDGSLLQDQRKTAPSMLAEDKFILPAVLRDSSTEDEDIPSVALDLYKGYINIDLNPERGASSNFRHSSRITASTAHQNRNHSLFELALQSASSVPQLPHLHTLLPDDAPPTVTNALETACKAHEEGGRVCSVCGRNYIIPRTEWMEYHHIIPWREALKAEGMFWPFLRRGCSAGCLPFWIE